MAAWDGSHRPTAALAAQPMCQAMVAVGLDRRKGMMGVLSSAPMT
jgi:hypothetical protein